MDAHTNIEIEKSVIRSQHTQRNFNLNKKLPKKDIDTLLHAVTNCPSKQNLAFYKVHFIQDRDIIEEIHENTNGFGLVGKAPVNGIRQTETNPQTLANLLVIFEDYSDEELVDQITKMPWSGAGQKAREYLKNGYWCEETQQDITRDKQIALGIAAGYLNLTASLMGYRTGCCQCMDPIAIREIAMLREEPLLLMGVGFPQEGVNRRRHHIRDFIHTIQKKRPIKYEVSD
jgi:nitroreductase